MQAIAGFYVVRSLTNLKSAGTRAPILKPRFTLEMPTMSSLFYYWLLVPIAGLATGALKAWTFEEQIIRQKALRRSALLADRARIFRSESRGVA